MKRICDIILVSSLVLAFVYCQQQTPQKQFQGRFQFGAGKVPANFDCPEDFGYYPHATDCTQYYVCVFGGALLESCSGGLVYSRELQTCDWPRNAGCNLTGESPVEKPAVAGFSTVRITDTRTEKTSSMPQAVTENSRRFSSVAQPQKNLGQEDFDSGFTLRPDNKESRLFRGDGRKIDSPVPRVQDVEERFTSTERLEEPRSGSRQGRRNSFEDYTDDQYSVGTSQLANNTYDDYDDYGSDYSTSTWKTWNLNSDLSTTEKQPLNRRLPLSNFLNRAIHRQEPSQPKQNRWQHPQTFHGTNTRQSGPVPLPVHSRFSNTPHSENDRSWPISLRIPSQTPAPRPPPQAVERFNDWSPGFRVEQSLSDNWRHTQNYFAPAPPKTPSFHSSAPSSIFGPEATGRKVLSHPSKSQTNFNAVTDRPLKTKQPAIDYRDYDYDSREIFEENRRPTEQQRFPQQAFREEAEFVPRPQTPPRLEPRPQFAPRPQEPSRIQLQPQEALKPSSPSPRPVESPVASSNAAAASEEIEEYYEYLYDEFGNPVFEEESGEVVAPSPQTTTQRPATTERTSTTTTKRPTTAFTTATTTASTTSTERAEPTEPATGKGSKVRGQMKFSETSAASAGQRVPSQKSSKKNRPTLKPVGALVPSKIEPVDVNKFAPWRFASVFETPEPDTPAEKCKPDICQLPDCHCGGKEVPGGLEAEDLPQIVLLTFDDSVNDLNKELYKDLFEKGRLNPNGCPIQATFYVSHEWTDYSQVQNLYADGHEIASHTVSHSFGEQFSTKKWARETAGQRDIMAAYAGVKSEDVRGMRAPFLSVGGNKMFKMLYDLNFTYDSSMPVYENNPPSYPYTLDYKIFHDCMIPPCPTRSYPGVWEVPMVMWQDLNGGRCSMGDGCSNPPDAEGIYKMLVKNFERHYTTNRAPFPLYYHAAWFTTPHHKEGFQAFLDTLVSMDDVWVVTNWQLIQWMREPTSLDKIKDFEPFKCSYPDRPKKCNNPKVCNLWHKSGVRYMKSCQPCPEAYPWTGKTGVKNSILEKYLADES